MTGRTSGLMDFSVLHPISGGGHAHLTFCLFRQTPQLRGKRTSSAENRGLSVSQAQSHAGCVQLGQGTTSLSLSVAYLYNGIIYLLTQ